MKRIINLKISDNGSEDNGRWHDAVMSEKPRAVTSQQKKNTSSYLQNGLQIDFVIVNYSIFEYVCEIDCVYEWLRHLHYSDVTCAFHPITSCNEYSFKIRNVPNRNGDGFVLLGMSLITQIFNILILMCPVFPSLIQSRKASTMNWLSWALSITCDFYISQAWF